MKKIPILLAAALLMATVTPAFSEMSQAEKDECMLASKNCTDQVDDIYKRIHRLNKEIKKGKRVYTPAELKKLQDKLTETQELLKTMEKPGR
jgi:peptidoglycan hydrolase CwlO-like protein